MDAVETGIRRALVADDDTTDPASLASLLEVDAAGLGARVFRDLAPEDAPFPRVLFRRLTAPSTYTAGRGAASNRTAPRRARFTRLLYEVLAISHGAGAGEASRLEARIDRLLDDADLDVGPDLHLLLAEITDRVTDDEILDTASARRIWYRGVLLQLEVQHR